MKRYALYLLLLCCMVSCNHKPGAAPVKEEGRLIESAPTLVLNEICGKEFPNNEWVEIYNCTDKPYPLRGVYLIKIDEDGIDHEIFRFKSGYLGPHQVFVMSSLQKELKTHLSRKKELGIELVDPQDRTLDSFYRDDEVGEHPHPTNGSYARIPNGTGRWAIVKEASRNQLNPDDAEEVDEGEETDAEE